MFDSCNQKSAQLTRIIGIDLKLFELIERHNSYGCGSTTKVGPKVHVVMIPESQTKTTQSSKMRNGGDHVLYRDYHLVDVKVEGCHL